MPNHYTRPSRLTQAAYDLVYDPLRAGYLRSFVASLDMAGTERVLDFGCGPGSEAAHLARALSRGGRLTCLDVSPAWLAQARRRLRSFDNVDFLLGEATELDLPAGGFDLVIAHFVIHDVDRASLPAVLRALARSLRPGGRFVVVEPASSRHGLTADELRSLMADADLTLERSEVTRTLLARAVRSTFRRGPTGPG